MTNKDNDSSLKAISPIDGRYSSQIEQSLKDINSEYGLINKRLYIEIKWFIFLCSLSPIKKKLSSTRKKKII